MFLSHSHCHLVCVCVCGGHQKVDRVDNHLIILCFFLPQITSDNNHVTRSYAIFNVTGNGNYHRIASVDDATVTVFNITGLHPNRGYSFSVQPISDIINGTLADCPIESCRTKQAGEHVHTNWYTLHYE